MGVNNGIVFFVGHLRVCNSNGLLTEWHIAEKWCVALPVLVKGSCCGTGSDWIYLRVTYLIVKPGIGGDSWSLFCRYNVNMCILCMANRVSFDLETASQIPYPHLYYIPCLTWPKTPYRCLVNRVFGCAGFVLYGYKEKIMNLKIKTSYNDERETVVLDTKKRAYGPFDTFEIAADWINKQKNSSSFTTMPVFKPVCSPT